MEIVLLLLQAGACPNARDDYARTPLHLASFSSYPSAVRAHQVRVYIYMCVYTYMHTYVRNCAALTNALSLSHMHTHRWCCTYSATAPTPRARISTVRVRIKWPKTAGGHVQLSGLGGTTKRMQMGRSKYKRVDTGGIRGRCRCRGRCRGRIRS